MSRGPTALQRWMALCWEAAAFRIHAIGRARPVGPIFLVSPQPSRKAIRFADGSIVDRGERVATIHLDNVALRGLHRDDPPPIYVASQFHQLCIRSFAELARLAEGDEQISKVRAFSANTILYRNLLRFGFEETSDRLWFARAAAAYQRILISAFRTAHTAPSRTQFGRSAVVWMKREVLLRKHRRPDLSSL